MRSRPILAKNNFFWGENSLGYQDFIWKNYLIMKGNGFLKCKNNWLFSSILTTQLSIFIFLLLKKGLNIDLNPKSLIHVVTTYPLNHMPSCEKQNHHFLVESLHTHQFSQWELELKTRLRIKWFCDNHPTLVFIPINWVGFQVLLNGWNNQHWQFSFAYVT